jgi:signal transduction histidine kinase
MKAFPIAVILLILAASVSLAGCTGPKTDKKTAEKQAVAGQHTASIEPGPGDPRAEATGARYANLTRFIERAASYAKEHGKEAALKEFNNPNGTFIEGDLYVFAYGMDGTTLALPYQQGLLGTDRRGISDSNGVEFIDGMIGIARDGGGSLYYIYKNPEDNYREEFKLSHVMPVDSEWFVGSGIYLPGLSAGFNATERDELVERVKEARRYAQVQGADRAIADYNDRNGVFANGSRYIFAYGYNGTTLALPFQPELIGTNRLNFTDPYGVKITAWEIATAKRGGGFVYVDYLNPDTGSAGLKLCYVAPVDDDWLEGSGIYTEGL